MFEASDLNRRNRKVERLWGLLFLMMTMAFPPMVTQMIHVGEKTGGLDDMLGKIADFYDEEVDAAVSALTSIIEPVIIVFMGVVIGGILVAMYMPMFDIIGKIA